MLKTALTQDEAVAALSTALQNKARTARAKAAQEQSGPYMDRLAGIVLRSGASVGFCAVDLKNAVTGEKNSVVIAFGINEDGEKLSRLIEQQLIRPSDVLVESVDEVPAFV